jgi:DNA-binding CsgD family transcriptional regulator
MPTRGETNAEIARILWLSPGTVRKNLENVFAKLGIKTRTAAVAAYIGLLEDVEEARRVGSAD